MNFRFMFCEKCGQQIPEGQIICPNCGTSVLAKSQSFENQGPTVFQNPNYTVPPQANNFSSYNNQDEELLEAFVGKGSDARLFQMADTGKGFNVLAMFFGAWYYFYRKVYLGAFLSGLITLGVLFVMQIFLKIANLGDLEWLFNGFSGVIGIVIAGFCFPYFYKKNADKALTTVKTEYSDVPFEGQKEIMESLGGTSVGSLLTIWGINTGLYALLLVLFMMLFGGIYGDSKSLDSFGNIVLVMYMFQAIVFIIGAVLLFRDHININKKLERFIRGNLTAKNLVLGIIAVLFAVMSLVLGLTMPGVVKAGITSLNEQLEENNNSEVVTPVETPDISIETPDIEVTPEPTQEPEVTATPEISSTAAAESGQYVLEFAPNQTLTLTDIPGMRVSTYDDAYRSSVSFVSDKDLGATDNVMVMYMVSSPVENLDSVGKYSGFDDNSNNQYSYVEKKEVTINGKRCIAYHYGYPGHDTSYVSLYQDVGASKLVLVLITDWENTYTFDEMINNYSIILD